MGSFTRSETVMAKAFSGSSRKLGGDDGHPNTVTPLSNDEKVVLDPHFPSSIPKEKVTFSTRWTYHPKGDEGVLSFGKIGIIERIVGLKWGTSGTMGDSEIHIIYLPHLPVEEFREKNIEMSLMFMGTDNDDSKVMSRAVFPSSLHTHVIFYPGHTFSIKRGARFPWEIQFHTEADVRPDYPIADIIVMYKGYNLPVGQHSQKRGANIISLVPTSEVPSGVVLTRPRFGSDWKIMGLQYGVKSQKDLRLMQTLQECGIDIEGLQAARLLKKALAVAGSVSGDTTIPELPQKHQKIRDIILAMFPS